MADVSNINNKEYDSAFESSDDTIITNTGIDINDLDKLITKVMVLKMFITDQIYLLKQQIGNPKTPECNYNSKSHSYITSRIEQIHYLKEENKMKNSFFQTLLSQKSSTTVPNDLFHYNDKVDENSPASNNDHVSD